MSDIMEFAGREEFRKWLYKNCLSNDGIWLLFGKSGGPKNFSMRRENSKWSEKNKALVGSLEERGAYDRFRQKENRGSQKKRSVGCTQTRGDYRGAN